MTILDAPTRIIIPAMWLAWAALWIVAAFYTKATRWRESIGSPARHVVPFLFFFVLLTARVVAPGRLLPLLGALLVGAGLGLAVWARWHLGRNWSGVVTLKQDHALIRTGPYRAIRHPIYTGLLLALVGTAAAIGEWPGVLAVICALAGILWKLRVEEERMRQTFAEYEQYRKGTAALIPLLY